MTKPFVYLTLTDELAYALSDLYDMVCDMHRPVLQAETMKAARAALRRARSRGCRGAAQEHRGNIE